LQFAIREQAQQPVSRQVRLAEINTIYAKHPTATAMLNAATIKTIGGA
jgi:hypothetical protein